MIDSSSAILTSSWNFVSACTDDGLFLNEWQPGGFALVASIYYDIDDQAHRTTFYNGTVEVVEAHGFFSGETLFLITLGLGLSGLLGIWAYGQIQRLSKV